MKTPDGLSDALDESCGYDEDSDEKTDALKIAEKWFKWGEYVSVEIDTVAKTCVVLEN